ncbi:MAG: N-formylglutamate amidohydrolase [Pseudomonadota bacterium]
MRRPESIKASVLFASPHSGSHYPEAFVASLQVPMIDIRRTEDAFVDELFSGCVDAGAPQLRALYGRCYVDLNRDSRELDIGMFVDGPPRNCGMPSARVRAGLGCLPRIASSGQDIYSSKLQQAEGRLRLETVYDAYHGRLIEEVEAMRASSSRSYVIDCHSMPSSQPGRPSLPDIVLGDRFGSSCENALTGCVERAFRSLGYSVTRNAPYAGGHTTRRYGRPRRGDHALQIEINRGLYMNESDVLRTGNFEKVRADVQSVVIDIIDHVARQKA